MKIKDFLSHEAIKALADLLPVRFGAKGDEEWKGDDWYAALPQPSQPKLTSVRELSPASLFRANVRALGLMDAFVDAVFGVNVWKFLEKERPDGGLPDGWLDTFMTLFIQPGCFNQRVLRYALDRCRDCLAGTGAGTPWETSGLRHCPRFTAMIAVSDGCVGCETPCSTGLQVLHS